MSGAGAVVAVVVALAACTPGGQTAAPQPGAATTAGPPAASAAPSAAPPATPSERASAPPSEAAASEAPPTGDATACPPAVLAEIDATIDGQLAAFRDGDFARALDFATAGFRSGFTPERFEEVITGSFPAARRATGHTSRQCVTDGSEASVLVEVSGDAGSQELVYQLSLEDGRWRIGGAVPHGGDSDSSTV